MGSIYLSNLDVAPSNLGGPRGPRGPRAWQNSWPGPLRPVSLGVPPPSLMWSSPHSLTALDSARTITLRLVLFNVYSNRAHKTSFDNFESLFYNKL
jgi:hypothetical protein